ncbi:MAG: sigma-70 family RNA polymerase sigma factor [Planctomycetes bacterium]|nr:sigma-70 family RNA polymerase sigma factor [Planctomycetota bacterium]
MTPVHTTPVSLLQRLGEPTGDAWEQFVRLYTPLLYAWASRAGLQDADAADLVQEVLLLLIAKLPEFRYDPGRSFRAWLRTVTLNKYRERRRRAALPVTSDPRAAEALTAPDDPEAFWETEYRQNLVGEALRLMQAEFQPTTWKACWEHLACGRPAAEVGSELNLNPGAVRAATFRVLTRLRQHLAGLLD